MFVDNSTLLKYQFIINYEKVQFLSEYNEIELKFISELSSKLFLLYKKNMPQEFKEIYRYENNIRADIMEDFINNTDKSFSCRR